MVSKTHKVPFRQLAAFAHALADISAKAIIPHFRKPISVENKAPPGSYDPVTKADRAAERAIAKALKRRYPDHTLVGEEFGTQTGQSPYRWIIDPIDGTKSFIMGSPIWGTLIGLLDGDDPVLGLMDQPFTGERYWSEQTASYLRTRDGKARRIKTRACGRLAEAIMTTTHPDLFERDDQRGVFARLKAGACMTRYSGDCYNVCLLAAGFVDVVIEPGVKSYDIAALIPIVERAGGRVTAWDGGPAANGGDVMACGDPRLHDAILKQIVKL